MVLTESIERGRQVLAGLSHSSPLAFAAAHMRTEQGLPCSFHGARYTETILQDPAPTHVCIACAQSRKTVTYLSKTLWLLMYYRPKGWIPTAIYTFPTKTDVDEFSKARAKPMIESSPLLSEEISDLDSAGVKRGKSGWTLYFRGTYTDRAALSVPAGLLVHDELDRSKPDTLQMYSDRSRASTHPHVFMFSTPTIPQFGISAQWVRCDQREWVWRCDDCDKEQVFAPMDKSCSWRDHLDTDTKTFRCRYCGAPVSRAAVIAGQWVPMQSEYTGIASGYHITGIMPELASAERLCDELEKAEFPELFVQGHIGLPEVSGESQITPDMIRFGDWANTLRHKGPLYAGLDQGKHLDFIAGDGNGKIVAVHRFNDWAEVQSAMRTLEIRMLVADGQPDPRPLQELVSLFPGRVLIADYTLNAIERVPYERLTTEPRVRMHRTGALDWGRDRIIMGEDGGDVFPALPVQAESVLKAQLCSPQRTIEKDQHGNPRAVWIETGPDHFRHAHGYYTVACALAPRGSVTAIDLNGRARDGEFPMPPPGVQAFNEVGEPIDPETLRKMQGRTMKW